MEILIVILAGLILIFVFRDGKGARGERRVNNKLHKFLNPKIYTVLDNLIIPSVGGSTQIDHVVVSKYGVFVVETKNYGDWIFGQERQMRWTQVVYKQKHSFQNPLFQNFKHLKAIQNLTGLEVNQLFNLVVFVGNAKFKTNIPNHIFIGTSKLNNFILSQKEILLAPLQVSKVTNLLLQANTGGLKQARKEHLQQVRANTKPVSLSGPLPDCPRCGESMTVRVAKSSGKKFWGCSSYPKCRGTRSTKN